MRGVNFREFTFLGTWVNKGSSRPHTDHSTERTIPELFREFLLWRGTFRFTWSQ
jgi:hypothetical protein